VPQATGVFKV